MIVSMLNVMPSHVAGRRGGRSRSSARPTPRATCHRELRRSQGECDRLTSLVLQLLQQGEPGHHQGDESEEGQTEQQPDAVRPERDGDADGDDGQDEQPDDRRARSSGCAWAGPPSEMILSSQNSVARWLARPRRDADRRCSAASPHLSSWPAIQKAATTSASGDEERLLLVAQHLEARVGARRRASTSVGHGGVVMVIGASRPQGGADADPEADGAGDDAEADADEREDRRRAGRLSTRRPRTRAGDDGADEEATEARRGRGLARRRRSAHRPFTQVAFVGRHGKTSALRPLGEVHRAKSDDCAKLPQRAGPRTPGSGVQEASERGLRSAVVMVGGRPVVGRWSVLVKTSTKSGRARKPGSRPTPRLRAPRDGAAAGLLDAPGSRKVRAIVTSGHRGQRDPHPAARCRGWPARCRRRPAPPTAT